MLAPFVFSSPLQRLAFLWQPSQTSASQVKLPGQENLIKLNHRQRHTKESDTVESIVLLPR